MFPYEGVSLTTKENSDYKVWTKCLRAGLLAASTIMKPITSPLFPPKNQLQTRLVQIDTIYVLLQRLVRLYKVHSKVTQHMAALLWAVVPGRVHHHAPVIETDWWNKSDSLCGIWA